jgi:hypothetical protein
VAEKYTNILYEDFLDIDYIISYYTCQFHSSLRGAYYFKLLKVQSTDFFPIIKRLFYLKMSTLDTINFVSRYLAGYRVNLKQSDIAHFGFNLDNGRIHRSTHKCRSISTGKRIWIGIEGLRRCMK